MIDKHLKYLPCKGDRIAAKGMGIPILFNDLDTDDEGLTFSKKN